MTAAASIPFEPVNPIVADHEPIRTNNDRASDRDEKGVKEVG